MKLISAPKLSALALQDELKKRGVEIDYEASSDILENIGMLDPSEKKDTQRADKSLWAEMYSHRIARRLKLRSDTCYNVMRSFEEIFLGDLFFKKKKVKIPHCFDIFFDGRQLRTEESLDSVTTEIKNILSARELKNRLAKISRREKKLRGYGSFGGEEKS